MSKPRAPQVGDTVHFRTIFGEPGLNGLGSGPHDADVSEFHPNGYLRLHMKGVDLGLIAHVDSAGREGRWWEYPPGWPREEPEAQPTPAALNVFKL